MIKPEIEAAKEAGRIVTWTNGQGDRRAVRIVSLIAGRALVQTMDGYGRRFAVQYEHLLEDALPEAK